MAIEDPDHPGHLFSSSEIEIHLSDVVKYCVLSISVLLLLASLAILMWQIYKCFCDTNPGYDQESEHTEFFYAEEKSSVGNYAARPSVKLQDQSTEAHRWSRCLSPSDSSLSDLNVNEQETYGRVSGSLRFSVLYDQLRSRLEVSVLHANELSDDEESTALQAFVKVRLMRSGPEEKRSVKKQQGEDGPPVSLWTVLQEWDTRLVKGDSNPLFGDQFSFSLRENGDELQLLKLRMEVINFDKFSRQTVLGAVRLSLASMDISALELQKSLQKPEKDLVGEVLLSLKFLPASKRLDVGLLKIRTAPTDAGASDSGLFARISVRCNQSRLQPQKSPTVTRAAVTVFNQVFMFSLADSPPEQCHISVSVYETRGDGKAKAGKALVGHFNVAKDKTSEDEHWSLMLRSARQPVAKWHGLLI